MEDIKNIQWPGWEVTRLIGNGSFGSVYEIQRNLFGNVEKAALKVVHIPQSQSDIDELYNDGFDEESIIARFRRYREDIVNKYSAMSKMKGHPNVVSCDDVKCVQHDDGIGWAIYIKMELLSPPIIKCLDRVENESAVINLGISMCNALALYEKQNIIHGGVKPQNIFLSQDGTFKLGELSLTDLIDASKIGNIAFAPPEFYANHSYGPSSDQYSLGLVMYWLLNDRKRPFCLERATHSEADAALKRRINGEQIPPPAHGNSRLNEIILKACSYDPSERYESVVRMLQDLKDLKQNTGTCANIQMTKMTKTRNKRKNFWRFFRKLN